MNFDVRFHHITRTQRAKGDGKNVQSWGKGSKKRRLWGTRWAQGSKKGTQRGVKKITSGDQSVTLSTQSLTVVNVCYPLNRRQTVYQGAADDH